jgi:hypothetical protein
MTLGVRRTLGLLLAVTLLASGAAKGWCFMPGMASADQPGAHDCCKKGWTAATPECCLIKQAPDAPGRLGARTAVIESPQPAFFLTPLPSSTSARVDEPSRDHDHSPPGPFVLRV